MHSSSFAAIRSHYNLPPQPEVPTTYLRKGWISAGIAAGFMLAGTLLAFGEGDIR